MLRRAILLTAVLLLLNCFPFEFAEGGVFQSHPSPVETEEYAAYSAFINQKYLPSYSTPMYTLQGELIEDGELDENGTVVILASTREEFSNVVGVSRYMLKMFLGQDANQEAEETFDDLISKSGRPTQLSKTFHLTVPYELAGDKEWDRDKFLERFPRSKGLLSFSRVGFDASRNKALFLVAQLDLNTRRAQHPSESTYLVLLNKEGGQWKVKKMWGPERKSFVIDLKRCDNASQHISLPLGSESFRVIGRDRDRCVIEYEREREQGYARTRCRVPVGLGKLTIFEGGLERNVFVFSTDLSKSCGKPVYGNSVFDRIKPERF